MTGLAAGYAIGIVGDAVSSSPRAIEEGPVLVTKEERRLIFVRGPRWARVIVRKGVFVRIEGVRLDGLDPHFRVSRLQRFSAHDSGELTRLNFLYCFCGTIARSSGCTA